MRILTLFLFLGFFGPSLVAQEEPPDSKALKRAMERLQEAVPTRSPYYLGPTGKKLNLAETDLELILKSVRHELEIRNVLVQTDRTIRLCMHSPQQQQGKSPNRPTARTVRASGRYHG